MADFSGVLHDLFINLPAISGLLKVTFWLMTECRSRAYAILICLLSSSSLSSVSTPPDHMLGQIRFILCIHMQLYPV